MKNGHRGRPISERITEIEKRVAELHVMQRQAGILLAVMATAMGYPDAVREIMGLEVTVPERKSSGGIVMP